MALYICNTGLSRLALFVINRVERHGGGMAAVGTGGFRFISSNVT